MTQFLFSNRAKATAVCGIVVVLGAMSAGTAMANKRPAYIDTTKCTRPHFTQPFLAVGDRNWYTLAPGQSVGAFNGAGWTLTGGAQVESANLANSGSGSILDLPYGSSATSPAMCVDSGFKTARTMLRNVTGKGGLRVTVSYEGTKSAVKPQNAGHIQGDKTAWTTSNKFSVKPSSQPGWQLVQFTFTPDKSSEYQIYNFYVDPRMK